MPPDVLETLNFVAVAMAQFAITIYASMYLHAVRVGKGWLSLAPRTL